MRVGAAVARVLGDDQAALVEHRHEARRAAARRGVAIAGGVRGREQEERRTGDEGTAVLVEMVDLLAHWRRVGGRRGHDRAQLVLAPDQLAEDIHGASR